MDGEPGGGQDGRAAGAGDGGPGVAVSVVAPAHNEAGNIAPLVAEVEAALAHLPPLGKPFEFVIVDDGSTDTTRQEIAAAAAGRPWLRCVAMAETPPGRGNGQSAAFHAGFRAARGGLIAVLDADLQNDPADIPRLIDELERTGADFVQGDRSAARRKGDAWVRQAGSVVGRLFRRGLLGDTIRDTGCSLRVMRREIALRLPLEFRGVHRFIPVLARQMGYDVRELAVNHRSRNAGETKYGAGITKRALPGLIDCFAVRWMRARRRPVTSGELALATHDQDQPASAAAAPAAPERPASEISPRPVADAAGATR